MNLKITLGWMAMAFALAAGQEEPKIEYKPLRFGGSQEFGRASRIVTLPGALLPSTDEWIDHFGAYFIQEAEVDDRLDLRVGLGGVFQFPKPEREGTHFSGTQSKMFYVGPAVAQAVYRFGENPDNPTYTFGGGMFPYKYNPDAANLGEYLFRSTPYPSTLSTGGLNVVNDNAAYLQGFIGTAKWGDLRMDVLLTTETNLAPLYDFSPAVVLAYAPEGGLFTLGAGANYRHLIQVRPSRTVVHSAVNSYFTRNGETYTGNAAYYTSRRDYYLNAGTTATNAADAALLAGDSAGAASYTARAASYTTQAAYWDERADSLDIWTDASSGQITGGGVKYYTPAGLVLMARGDISFNKLLRLPMVQDHELKLFAEVAILGAKNYDFYYEDVTERMPIMVGLNLPTFGTLDLLTAQVEYFKSPHLNSYFHLANNNAAVPYTPSPPDDPVNGNDYSRSDFLDVTGKDNISWSVLAKKSFLQTFSISAQVARDHMRTVHSEWWYSSKQQPHGVLPRTKDWYWMLQFGWNI